MIKALDGIKVLDLSRYGPVRYCTVSLAQLGAEVITIEDPTFAEGPRAEVFCNDTNVRYRILNRGKKSMLLNLKLEEGKQIFYQLAKETDVITEANRPGVAQRLRVDYETIKKINPRIIYCSITGYGQTGPYALRPGHDINYVALGGVLSLTGERDRPPVSLGAPIADVGSSMLAVSSIMAALMLRERTGKGTYIDVAMMDTVLYFLWFQAGRFYLDGKSCQRGTVWAYGADPRNNIYETKDGKYVTLSCFEPWIWENFCRVIGREDLTIGLQDIELQSPNQRTEEILSILREIFRSRTREEWVSLLGEENVNFSPVLDLDEVFDEPYVSHRQMIVEVKHPRLGSTKGLGFPVKFSDMETSGERPIPTYGEHTEEVLTKLGYSREDIAKLSDQRVIR